MSWFMAGSAALSVGTTYLSASSSARSSARQAGAQSRAEGEAIAKERLNTTVRNSYNTAFAQMQLGQRRMQLSKQGADIGAMSLAAHGDADTANAATGSIGASVQAVIGDIDQKSQAALDATQSSFEGAVENYNAELDMMVLNTDQSAPTVRPVQYLGPSSGEMFGLALAQGATQFASSYAMRKMSLGLGKPGTT